MEPKEIEQTLSELDDKVGRLRALYEQFFMGIEKLEPQTPRKEVDRVIAQMRKLQLRNTAQRFRLQTIIQRYNTMQQHWGRTLREMEAGTFRRDVLRAAERFGVDDAVTAVGKRRAAKLAMALERKRAQERERETLRRRHGEPGLDEPESVSDADLLEDEDDDDDAPTPPPLRPRPPVAQVWELHDPGEELTYVPPGAEPIPAATTTSTRPLGINPFGGRARTPSISQFTEAADSSRRVSGLDATAPYPSAVQLNLAEGSEKAEKKTSGGLRLGGGPRRASAEALLRIASALGGDVVTAPAPAVTAAPPARAAPGVTSVPPARSSTSGLHAGFRAPQASPAASTPPTGSSFSPGPPPSGAAAAAAQARKPLLSQPLDIDLSGMAAPPPARPSAPVQPAVAPPARKPLLSQPLDIDALGPAAAPPPDSSRAPAGAALRPPPAANRPAAPRVAEAQPPREPAAPRAPSPGAARADTGPAKDLSEQRMREIYSQYVQTRRERNEPTTNITYEKLSESLRSQTEKLKQKHASKTIDYEVVVKDGKTLIKPIVR
jgi:hypothetical protein